eukprot:TRINITY_DN7498_c0_g1_i1.p1 TRINITY_DN7498_c0_g1~~TRINITY_DN7498_c0_g1_i1.p1  ORF type:complete len:823 (-),score=187.70 TRINITY_DN7498_c0_g1_i1:340-2808(-)
MDEEAQKRNTDCVYFLASPLTCKKGIECEFRHSESARINPRDCWYWLSGNCLNLNCSFRHPPLDGHPGGAASTSAQISSSASSIQSTSTNKAKVPCYYFNQGYCAKGDKCPFLHGAYSYGPSLSWKTTKAASTLMDPQASSKQTGDDSTNNKSGHDPSVPNVSLALQSNGLNTVQPSNKPSTSVSQSLVTNHLFDASVMKASASRMVQPPASSFQPNTINSGQFTYQEGKQNMKLSQRQSESKSLQQGCSLQNAKAKQELEVVVPEFDARRERGHDPSRAWSRMHQPADNRLQNGTDNEDTLGRSSPGFDVLVDDAPEHLRHQEDVAYLRHNMEISRGMLSGQEYSMHNKGEFPYYDYEQPDENVPDESEYFDDIASYEPVKQRGYDLSGRKQSNAFDDRVPERSTLRKRRSLSREDNHVRNNVEDLRHMISKRRRNGVAVADNLSKRQHIDIQHTDHSYSRHKREYEGSSHQDIMQRDYGSRRLHGRIKADNVDYKGNSFDGADSSRDRRPRPRTSPPRYRLVAGFRSKFRESERKTPGDGSMLLENRVSRGYNSKAFDQRMDSVDFAGPKTLAQIKQEKNRENSEKTTGIMSSSQGSSFHNMPGHDDRHGDDKSVRSGKLSYESGGEPDFEGPKPLSDILKAKGKQRQPNDTEKSRLLSEELVDNNQKCIQDSSHKNPESSDGLLPLNEKENNVFLQPAAKMAGEGGLHCGVSEKVMGDPQQRNASGSSIVEGFEETRPPIETYVKVLDARNVQQETTVADVIRRDEDENMDHKKYEMQHKEIENDEWDKNVDQMHEAEEEYFDDDDDDAFARKLGGFFS